MIYYTVMFLSQFYAFMEEMIREFFLIPKLSANEILVHMKMYFQRFSQLLDDKLRPIAPIICILFLPLTVIYYTFFVIPYSIYCFVYDNVSIVVDIVTRRSIYTRQLFRHMVALRDIIVNIWRYIIDTKIADLVHIVIEALLDVRYMFIYILYIYILYIYILYIYI